MEFGELLRELRVKKKKSIKTMAIDIGLNYTYISKLENFKMNPSSKVINKISKYFNYNSEELLLLAGKLPKDIENILRNNPKEAAEYLRRKFGGARNKRK